VRRLTVTIASMLLGMGALAASGEAAPLISAGQPTVRILAAISIEKVRYASIPPVDDFGRPFDPLRAGDQVFVRVTALHDGGPPLRTRRARINVVGPEGAEIAIVGRNGVQQCAYSHGGAGAVCPITRKLREEEQASVLFRITMPEGLPAGTARFVGSVTAAPLADIRIQSKSKSAKVPVSGLGLRPGPWSGTWTWRATWLGGSFTGHGMTIRQDGTTACASWSWSADSAAKGTVADDTTFDAEWRDSYGSGTWILILDSGGDRFTGTQIVNPHSPSVQGFVATIVGDRTGGAGTASLSCSNVHVRSRAPTKG
jgi:hypothetical protein